MHLSLVCRLVSEKKSMRLFCFWLSEVIEVQYDKIIKVITSYLQVNGKPNCRRLFKLNANKLINCKLVGRLRLVCHSKEGRPHEIFECHRHVFAVYHAAYYKRNTKYYEMNTYCEKIGKCNIVM